jgi:hypothetical protein
VRRRPRRHAGADPGAADRRADGVARADAAALPYLGSHGDADGAAGPEPDAGPESDDRPERNPDRPAERDRDGRAADGDPTRADGDPPGADRRPDRAREGPGRTRASADCAGHRAAADRRAAPALA